MNHTYELIYILSEKWRWLTLGALLLFAALFGVSVSVTPVETNTSAVPSRSYVSTATYDSPNAVTNSVAAGSDEFSRAMASTEQTLTRSSQTVVLTLGQTGKAITRGLSTGVNRAGSALVGSAAYIGKGFINSLVFAGRTVGNSMAFMARAIGNGVAFMFNIPVTLLGFAADTTIVSAVIKPGSSEPLQTIDSSPPLKVAVQAALPAAQVVSQIVPEPDSVPVWPIRGEVTTLFGVPHWPYQPTHTGMDISDGKPSGVTPIRPFKPGRVVQAIRSNSGLGNHVVVDHGEGMTSVYAHMFSTDVAVGQIIDKDTVLGYEGSTGASTGTHLHFEIRINDQPVDPQQYINGLP